MNFKQTITQDYSEHGLHKFKFYYEDVQENNQIYRKVTRADRAWDRVTDISVAALSAVRHLFRTVRKVNNV